MRGYFRRVFFRRVLRFGHDIRLFLLYNLLANVGFGVAVLVYNLYLTELDLREDYIGAFSAVQTLSVAATALGMGRLLERFGTWRAILGGFVTFLAASLGLAFAEQPVLLLGLAALYGVGLSFLFTATMPFIIEWGRRDHRQEIAALTFSLISLAVTAGSLVGGFVPALLAGPLGLVGEGSLWAYRWTLVAGTAVGSLGLVPLLRMGPARRGLPTGGRGMARVVEDEADRRQARRDMGVFVLVGGLLSLGVGMVVPFYNVYLTTLGASAREVGLVYAAGGLAAAVIGLFAPAVSRRLGSLGAVVLVRLSVVPFFVLLLVSPGYGLAVAAHLVRQTSISMAWPLDSTFIAEVLPARLRSSVFGVRSGVWNIGFSLASLAGGAIIVRAGYGWTFASLVLFSVLSVGLYVGYFGRHPRVRAGEIPSALPRRVRGARGAADA